MSRVIFEREIKGNTTKEDTNGNDKLSESDKYALSILKEVLENAKTYY